MASNYPFASPNAQRSSFPPPAAGGGYPTYPTYTENDAHQGTYGGGDGYAYNNAYPHHSDPYGPGDGGGGAGNYAHYDNAAYGQGGHQQQHMRNDSFVSDYGGPGMSGPNGVGMADEKYAAAAYGDPSDPYQRSREESYQSYANGANGRGMGAGVPGQGGTYTGKSIWSKEDKSAFQQRSGFGKVCGPIFCVVFLGIITVISAICLIFIFARPPAFALTGVTTPVPSFTGSVLSINSTLRFTVANPNSISVELSRLNADITTKNVPNITAGQGSLSNQKIASNTNTTINFPFSINVINTKGDPNHLVLADVNNQCGLVSGGGGGKKLAINIKVDARISVLGIGVTIPVTVPLDIDCPDISSLTGSSDLAGLLGSALSGGGGGNAASAVSGLLGGRDPQNLVKMLSVVQASGGAPAGSNAQLLAAAAAFAKQYQPNSAGGQAPPQQPPPQQQQGYAAGPGQNSGYASYGAFQPAYEPPAYEAYDNYVYGSAWGTRM